MADDGTVTWAELLTEARSRLGSEIDARRIVEEVSGHEGAELVLARGEAVTERAMARYDDLVARRSAGEPLQYVLGHWGFRSLDLMVDRRVLIPRPETEVLVDLALRCFDRTAQQRGPGAAPLTVVDLGTGSGAIALSIAGERVGSRVWATDRSEDALAVARANLVGIGRAAARVRLAAGRWFDALDPALERSVDLIVANPPYVATSDQLPPEVASWEPASALQAGPDGLDDLRVIVAGAMPWMAPGGYLVLEMDPRQVEQVIGLARGCGFGDVEAHADLAGRTRFVTARRP